LKPVANSIGAVSYTCIKYEDDKRMYNPLEPFPLSEVPAGSWSTYTLGDHKCGSIALLNKYYKVVVATDFRYEYVVDIWGDRAFRRDGKVWKLRYDEFGLANAAVNPNDEKEFDYLYYRFKEYNKQKLGSRKSATLFPTLPKKYLDSVPLPNTVMAFATAKGCVTGSTDAQYPLTYLLGIC
jgi:hypothetical protein